MLMQPKQTWTVESVPVRMPSTGSSVDSKLTDFGTFVGMLRRRKLSIAIFVLVTVALSIAYSMTTRPLFTAETTVYIDLRNGQVLSDAQATLPATEVGLSTANVDSQVQIIKSEDVALKVIKQLGLQNQEEFLRPNSQIVALIQQGLASVRDALHMGTQLPDIVQDGVPRFVVEDFSKRLVVKRVDETFVLSISFMSEDRQRSADIANAVANTYLNEQLDARFTSVKRASQWLEDRVSELRKEVATADEAVQTFKRQHGIYGNASGQLISDEQLAALADRVAVAHQDTLARQAKYAQIQDVVKSGDPNAAVVDSLNSQVMSKLQDDYSTNVQQANDIAQRFGADHESVKQLEAARKGIRDAMLQELTRISEVYRNDAEIAKRNEADLTASLTKAKSETDSGNTAQVTLRELERQASTYRNLYETFLDRYKGSVQQQSFPITDARVLTEATPPREKSSPKTLLNVILAVLGGGFLGAGFAFTRELNDKVFRTPAQVESILGVLCLGVVPKLRATKTKAKKGAAALPANEAARPLKRELGLLRQAARDPLSRFAETLRSVRLTADLGRDNGAMRVIGVVSSVPGEGKSTIAMNLAELIASSGKRVLIIDADLRNPGLSNEVAPDRKNGLLEFLLGKAALADVIYTNSSGTLGFVPACHGQASHTSELLGSARMEELLADARNVYDYVIVDLPPLAPVVDARAIAGAIDGFVFVVEWGQTSFATATHALHETPIVNTKVIGCVLNKTDLKDLRIQSMSRGSNQYYSYNKFGAYGQG